jgi:WD40 repeat protein
MYLKNHHSLNLETMKKIINLNLIVLSSIQADSQTLLWSNVSHPDQREVYGVAFSADGTRALSGSECHETRLRLWDVATGNLRWDINAVVSYVFYPEGSAFLNIHPNPADDLLYVGLPDSEISYKIISVSGTLVQQGNIGSEGFISASELKPGFYVLQLTLPEGTVRSGKFVKK